MNSVLRIRLQTSPAQRDRLRDLQSAFARVCNALAPMVQRTRCWNRVALHHMTYKALRQQFPEVGSQMICNAIYSVSRASRSIYQNPASPFNLARLGTRPLPRLHFLDNAPVYFDRHTLSLKAGQASMYTLDGRMRFQMELEPENEQRFRDEKLREIALTREGEEFVLTFLFAEAGVDGGPARQGAELPEYMLVIEDEVPPPAAPHPASQTLHMP